MGEYITLFLTFDLWSAASFSVDSDCSRGGESKPWKLAYERCYFEPSAASTLCFYDRIKRVCIVFLMTVFNPLMTPICVFIALVLSAIKTWACRIVTSTRKVQPLAPSCEDGNIFYLFFLNQHHV